MIPTTSSPFADLAWASARPRDEIWKSRKRR
jgi:hypothetical protein